MHIYRTVRLKYCLLLQQSTKVRSSLRAHWQPYTNSFSISPAWHERREKERNEKIFCTSFVLLSLSALLISAKRRVRAAQQLFSVQNQVGWGLEQPDQWKMSLVMAGEVEPDELWRSNPNDSTIPCFCWNEYLGSNNPGGWSIQAARASRTQHTFPTHSAALGPGDCPEEWEGGQW